MLFAKKKGKKSLYINIVHIYYNAAYSYNHINMPFKRQKCYNIFKVEILNI